MKTTGKITDIAVVEIIHIGKNKKLQTGKGRSLSDYRATLNWLLPEDRKVNGDHPFTLFITRCEEVYHNLLCDPHKYQEIITQIEDMELNTLHTN